MTADWLRRVVLGGLAGALLALPAPLLGKGGVYTSARHADPATGAFRDATRGRGECAQCHVAHGGQPFALFAANTNGLCSTSGCHDLRSANHIYQGPATYDASSHATSPSMVWPGFDGTVDPAAPRARPAGDRGKCVNCHDPHGYDLDGAGLIPSLAVSREEKLCDVCHDGSPAAKNIKAEFAKTSRHPVSTSGIHTATEDGAPAAYGARPTNNRHAECVDCHNPHSARSGAPVPPATSYSIMGVGRIAVTNGGAGTVPIYTYLAPSDSTPPVAEYQLCFKCHSSWTTLPTGARDKAVEFNPNNEAYHPVEAAGRNATTAMANNLAGSTGLPRLTTASTIRCTDCHASDAMPTTVSTLTDYAGVTPRGPHGSNLGVVDPNVSQALLRANYRVKLLLKGASGGNFDQNNFTLCLICHSPAPYADRSGDPRADTNFRFHGFHLGKIDGQGDPGNLDTPDGGNAGPGNAICKECHYQQHSTRLTYHATNRSYSRLVNFAPSVSGVGGAGSPAWNQANRSCSLRCHRTDHNPKNY